MITISQLVFETRNKESSMLNFYGEVSDRLKFMRRKLFVDFDWIDLNKIGKSWFNSD